MIRSHHTEIHGPDPLGKALSIAAAGLALSLGLFGATPALAQSLDGAAIRALALQGTWAAKNDWGYWSWSADNTVCLRVFGPEGDCADTGTWHIDGNVMCYELTWWGASYDVRKNCYTVHALEGGTYETRYHGGVLDTVFTTFKLVE